MGKGSYFGGSTLIGPGGKLFWRDKEHNDRLKKIDPDIQKEMDEQDRLRAVGIDPVGKSRLKEMRRARKRTESKD